jgi:8-oxo-dGTP pyrophosphatase MutT (NUDIX family)
MGIKKEFSAGGVVFQQPATSNQPLLWLVCQHSQHKGWVFPKGLIGDKIEGETVESTAVREVKEETGIDGKILKKLTPVTYFYTFNGEKRVKTVQYFLMKHLGGDITKHDHEMMAVEWLPSDKVIERLNYKSDKDTFLEVLKSIEKSPLG